MIPSFTLYATPTGSVKPRSVPVNINLPTLPQTPSLDNLLSNVAPDLGTTRRARITMTTPERPPISGLVTIEVTFDPERPRGVAVEIQGAVGVDVNVEVLEEVCRRGGLLGLPGRVWMKAHQPI